MKKYDVAVLGGGFAGVAAALAAARQGASVILVEKSNAFGGAATNCLVNPFMPYSTKINGERFDLSTGIFKEIHQKLAARGAMARESFLEEELKRVLQEMVLEAGIDVLFHACIYKVNKKDEKITSVAVAARGENVLVRAKYFVDATGDAQAAYFAGLPTRLGREKDNLCQPMTLCFRLGNVDVDKFYESRPALKEAHAKSLEAGELSNPRENILVFKTPIPNVLHFNTTRVVKKNPTDPFDVSEAELIAREQIYEIWDFMKKHADGLENSFLMATAAEIGVRESRMIVGEYVLTEADCRAFAKFDDAIAACNYDIDIHNPEGTGTSHYYFPDGKFYTIPYRSLIPRGAKNMLVAGRCISSDHGAQASYRIMPVVCCIGEAAGVAVALAARDGVDTRDICVKELQEKLVNGGAFIGI